MVRAEDSRPRGRGFNSRRILDGCKRFASYYIKEKLKIKVAEWGTPKKKKKKKKRPNMTTVFLCSDIPVIKLFRSV